MRRSSTAGRRRARDGSRRRSAATAARAGWRSTAPPPRPAVTHFAIAELLPTTTLLDVTLGTGRTHQIRVHLEAIGHPVVGDPTYCPPAMERFGLQRQFLHACRLALPHPVTGETLEVTSELPDDLIAALDRAARLTTGHRWCRSTRLPGTETDIA